MVLVVMMIAVMIVLCHNESSNKKIDNSEVFNCLERNQFYVGAANAKSPTTTTTTSLNDSEEQEQQ